MQCSMRNPMRAVTAVFLEKSLLAGFSHRSWIMNVTWPPVEVRYCFQTVRQTSDGTRSRVQPVPGIAYYLTDFLPMRQ